MRLTEKRVREIIRESVRQVLREWIDDDGEPYVSDRPTTVIWIDGPVDQMWVKKRLDHYASMPPTMLHSAMNDFIRMLEGEDMDSDVVEMYTNSDGTSKVTRQTMEAFVRGLERLAGI